MTARPDIGFVVEDLAEARASLVAALESAFPGIEVFAFADLAGARAWIAAALGPQRRAIGLIDLALPDGSGIDLIRLLAGGYPATLTVVTTIFDDDGHLFDALGAGAQGYLLKDVDLGRLGTYLRRIEQGEPPLSPSIARRMLNHFRAAAPRPEIVPPEIVPDDANLTRREVDVLQLIGRGLRVAEAADVLGLTEHTVAGYVKTIYRKLHVSSRAEAALEAARRGLV
ncbi:LuxR C-terminal-related transcriptional regulator [Zavarzinia compransoris]|uniref:DNA-binding response regulator n=1 Tax=Zavarzinia compransoris TaxID=1264899 RepID=A0A317ECJ8_9PROT|nr:response regulator transcription factor [Zavarzinia compransoris]PWR24006.1 DNA-binding response regulator [Zavarzinia compransoris]TDP48266.1 LuxR family two component transcriptional regulator [Zavarzinia compransoris]